MARWGKRILWAINGLVYLVIVALWIALTDEIILNLAVTAFALALSTILILLEREKLAKYYLSPQFKTLSGRMISAILLLAVLGIFNYWAYKIP